MQRVMTAKLTRLTHKIAIKLHPVTESCAICSSRSRRPVWKLLVTSSWSGLGGKAYKNCVMSPWLWFPVRSRREGPKRHCTQCWDWNDNARFKHVGSFLLCDYIAPLCVPLGMFFLTSHCLSCWLGVGGGGVYRCLFVCMKRTVFYGWPAEGSIM
jgi:hypothetical protein